MVEIKNGQMVLGVIKSLTINVVKPDETEEQIDVPVEDLDVRIIRDLLAYLIRRAQS